MESAIGLCEILAKIKTKPGMYIGNSSVSDLFIFLAGYKTARRELGVNPTGRELIFYEGFHEFVQSYYQIHTSKSWAKIIMLYCSDERQGLDRFFELLEKFENSSEKSQQIENNMVKV